VKFIKNISFYIVIAAILTFLSYFLKSNYLFEYLSENIITILLTLLAINTATTGLIASKIQDFVLKYPKMKFSRAIKEMKLSLFEQIILIATAIIILIFKDSQIIHFVCKEQILNTILLTVLIYAINNLWDTGKSVFIVIEQIQELNDKDDNK